MTLKDLEDFKEYNGCDSDYSLLIKTFEGDICEIRNFTYQEDNKTLIIHLEKATKR